MSDFHRNFDSIHEQKNEQLVKLIPDSLPDEIKQALKESVENLSKQEVEQEKFEEYVYKVNSDDIITQYSGLYQCQKLLSNPQLAVPIEQLIELLLQTRVHLKIFDIAQNNNIPLLRYEALWIICNIGCGTQKQIQTILDNDGINILFKVLDSEYDEIIELGVWTLANMAGDNSKFRDMLLQQGVLKPFVHLAQKYIVNQSNIMDNKDFEILKTLVWAFSNLVQGKKKYINIYIKDLLQIICKVIMRTEDDEDILNDACCALSYLSQDDDNLIDILIEEKITEKLIILLQKHNQQIVIPALRIIGNMLTGNQEQTNEVLKYGIIQVFEKLLLDKKRSIRKEVCWSLSNIAAGNSVQVKQIIRNDQLLKSIFLLLQNETPEVIEQIAYIMSNSVVHAELQDIDYLIMQYGFFQKMSILLDKSEKVVIIIALEGIYEIIKKFQQDERLEQYKKLMVDSKIMEFVQQNLNTKSKDISQNAKKVFEIYYSQQNC